MQDYYEQNIFYDVSNASVNLSFVVSFALVCLFGFSPLAQILISVFGIRPVLIMGTFFVVLGLKMASFISQIWHFYLTQGILFGIGSSFIYISVLGVTPHWFTKRRSLALGIIASGSGIGGLVFPFIITAINESLGPGWTYRILGFIRLAFDNVACVLIKERNAPAVRHRKKFTQIINFSGLKEVNYALFAIASNIGMFGAFVPYFFLPSYATYIGLSISQGSALISVSSACNFVGRVLSGLLADRFGKINTYLLFTVIICLSCFLIWTFAFSYGSVMAFAAVFGLTSGSFFALLSPITASLLGLKLFPSSLSFLLLSCVIPVFGPNIASAVEAGVNSTPFFSYKMFLGVAYLISTLIIIVLKFRLNRNVLAKV